MYYQKKQLFQGAIVALLKEGSSNGCFYVKIAHNFVSVCVFEIAYDFRVVNNLIVIIRLGSSCK